MPGLLIDEDLPRSLAPALLKAGFVVTDVRDVGLRGKSDVEILKYAGLHGLALVSSDLGFSSRVGLPSGSDVGLILVRFPNEMPIAPMIQTVINALGSLREEDIRGNVIIVEPGRVRLRRKR